MMQKQLLYLVVSLVLITSSMYGDSLWLKSSEKNSVYNSKSRFSIGDVVTVEISAESSAVQEAGTTTRKRTDIGANFYNLSDQYSLNSDSSDSLRQMNDYRLGGNDDYSGVGQTTRKSKVEAIVSCVVTNVLPNGNLVISGERMVDVNNDSEIIQISGIVRPSDVNSKNMINSYKIAQFSISLKGKGVVNSKQTPGFMSNFFSWLF